MVRSEFPKNWQDLLTSYVLGDLSDEDAALWERMLEEYPELLAELENYQSAFNLFADAVPMVQPPDRLLEKIHAQAQPSPAIKSPSIQASSKPRNRGQKRRFNSWIGAGGAIAAGLIAVLGWQLSTTHTRLQQANTTIQTLEQQLQQARSQAQTLSPVVSTLQQPGARIYSLQGSNLANTASGRLVMSEGQDVLIVVKNLPSLPEGQVYRLWADLPTESALTYCGQFNSNHEGVIALRPSSNQCGQNPTQMLITVDAATDPTTKGGPVVMQGQI